MNRADRRAFAKANGVPVPPPEPQPSALQFMPAPVSTNTAVADTPDGKRVVLQVQIPSGVFAFFLTPEHAEALIEQFTLALVEAKSSLVIARDVPKL